MGQEVAGEAEESFRLISEARREILAKPEE